MNPSEKMLAKIERSMPAGWQSEELTEKTVKLSKKNKNGSLSSIIVKRDGYRLSILYRSAEGDASFEQVVSLVRGMIEAYDKHGYR